jgi:hypothetical protein
MASSSEEYCFFQRGILLLPAVPARSMASSSEDSCFFQRGFLLLPARILASSSEDNKKIIARKILEITSTWTMRYGIAI